MLLTKRDVAARLGMSVRSVERHVCSELGDLARGLAVEMAVWEAFDLFALEGEEADS